MIGSWAPKTERVRGIVRLVRAGGLWCDVVSRATGNTGSRSESCRSQLIQRGSKEVHAIRATGCVANADPVTGERELTERSWWRV